MLVDWVIGVVLAVVGLVDWFLVTARIPDTARRVGSYSWRLSALPFVIGIAVGRGVAPDFGPPAAELVNMAAALAGIGVVVIVFHTVLWRFVDLPNWFSLIYLPCGVLPGMLVWPVAG